jgi:hypothetical protein
MTFGIEGGKSNRARWRRTNEDILRAIWIHEVEQKLHAALALAAQGRTCNWPTHNYSRDPGAPYGWPILIEPMEPTEPQPLRKGFPPVPGPGATFEEIKRYANVAGRADAYLRFDKAHQVPDEWRFSPAEAWAVAEKDHELSQRAKNQNGSS